MVGIVMPLQHTCPSGASTVKRCDWHSLDQPASSTTNFRLKSKPRTQGATPFRSAKVQDPLQDLKRIPSLNIAVGLRGGA